MSSTDIFISHQESDSKLAKALRELLVSGMKLEDKRVFNFSDADLGLGVGDRIDKGLLDALKQSRLIVALVTHNYLRSSWCMFELGAASALDKRVIVMRDKQIPDQSLRLNLSGLIMLDLANSDSVDSLTDTIAEELKLSAWKEREDSYRKRYKQSFQQVATDNLREYRRTDFCLPAERVLNQVAGPTSSLTKNDQSPIVYLIWQASRLDELKPCAEFLFQDARVEAVWDVYGGFDIVARIRMHDNRSEPCDLVEELDRRFRGSKAWTINVRKEIYPDERLREELPARKPSGDIDDRIIKAFIFMTEDTRISLEALSDACLQAAIKGRESEHPALVRCVSQSRHEVLAEVWMPCCCYRGLGEIIRALESSDEARDVTKATMLAFTERKKH